MTDIYWRELRQCCDHRHRDHRFIYYGRCRSGRRWFWHAEILQEPPGLHGWAMSEDEAIAAERDAVAQLADGQPSVATLRQDVAGRRLKEINAEKRRSRPPSAAKDSRVVEYLYSWGSHISDFDSSCERWIERYQIVKRTKRRVYYVREGEHIDQHGELLDIIRRGYDDEIGFVDRQKLEADGSVTNRGRHWSAADYHLFASLQTVLVDQRRGDRSAVQPDLAALKGAMAAAHPDKGGSSAAVIEARQRYTAARHASRHSL